MIGLYAIASSAAVEAVGAQGEPVRAVDCRGFFALVGLPPPLLSVEALRAHEAAVRQIAEKVEACLPARFGASALSDQALTDALDRRRAELTEALATVRGREQMTLRVHGQTAPVLGSPGGGPGTRYLEERRRARKLPELDPLRAALSALVRAERIERHAEPGLLASVYHLIDRGASESYLRAVQTVQLADLRVSHSGPWPAWSFAPEVAEP